MSAGGDPLEGRAVWSDADFEHMGWHDATVRALGLESDSLNTASPAELVLDLDYIVEWIDPTPPDEYFTFLVAPATLVFHDVFDLEGEFEEFMQRFEIDTIERGEPEESGYRKWSIEAVGPGGLSATFYASGFHQYFRARPVHTTRQHLTIEQRGGLSFARAETFDQS